MEELHGERVVAIGNQARLAPGEVCNPLRREVSEPMKLKRAATAPAGVKFSRVRRPVRRSSRFDCGLCHQCVERRRYTVTGCTAQRPRFWPSGIVAARVNATSACRRGPVRRPIVATTSLGCKLPITRSTWRAGASSTFCRLCDCTLQRLRLCRSPRVECLKPGQVRWKFLARRLRYREQ